MRCDRARELIDAYVDGELGGDDRAAVAAHVETCAECAELMADIRRTSQAVAALGRDSAPAALAPRLRSRLATLVEEERSQAWRPTSSAWRQAAVLVLCCALSAFVTWWFATSADQADRLQREVLTAHIRSLLQDSPIQVASSDAHTVKPWFAGKVDFAPEVKDLAAEGFPLLGGRLDYLDGRRVGAIVYRRRLHTVNVFMWHAPGAQDVAPTLVTRSGYNLLVWTKNGITYSAVSDLASDELKHLQALL